MSQKPCPTRDSDTPERVEPYLRLVDGRAGGSAPAERREHHAAWKSAPADHAARVLIAGADPAVRAHMLEELTDQLPADTLFAHASETWEVIAAASTSNMVVLAGDLKEMSGSSMMRLLGRRYPTLPVLAVAEKTPTRPAADVDVAHA
jgi:CheY-like chemotaxis protein